MEEQQQAAPAAPAPSAPKADPQDAEKNKVMGILAYILFLIPMLAAKDSKFAMYHANQGLVLFLVSIVGGIVLGFIPILGWIIGMFWPLVIIVFVILGIINASKGEMKPLPVIGGWQILK